MDWDWIKISDWESSIVVYPDIFFFLKLSHKTLTTFKPSQEALRTILPKKKVNLITVTFKKKPSSSVENKKMCLVHDSAMR